MNNLVTAALFGAALLLPSVALASKDSHTGGSATWEGNSGKLKDGCAFLSNEAGTMRYSEDTGEWEVTKPAKLKLRLRDVEEISVTAGNVLVVDGEAVTTADVDFRSNDTRITRSGRVLSDVKVGETTLEADDLEDSKIEIELGGSVVPNDPSFVTSSSTDYSIAHHITCEQ